MAPHARHPDGPAPRPGGLQFGLRAMLAGVALFGVLLIVMKAVGAVWSAIVAWLLVLIAAHVAANAWGTRIRRPGPLPPVDEGPPAARPVVFAPTSRLHSRRRVGRIKFVTAGGGALVGCLLGGWYLNGMPGSTLAGVLFGGGSAGVIGGLLGFLSGGCLHVTAGAVREAEQYAPPIRRRRRPAERPTAPEPPAAVS